jgi:D-amino-acid dehydrogenase
LKFVQNANRLKRTLALFEKYGQLTLNDMPLIGKAEQYNNFIYGMWFGWSEMTFASRIEEIVKELVIKDLKNKNSNDILLFSGF